MIAIVPILIIFVGYLFLKAGERYIDRMLQADFAIFDSTKPIFVPLPQDRQAPKTR